MMRNRVLPASLVTFLGALLLLAPPASAEHDHEHRGPVLVGDLGIAAIECDCSYESRARRWIFRTLPRVLEIAPDGPARGRLRLGDRIVAVNGLPLTSRLAGARLARLSPGVPVVLTVERDGRSITTRVVPEAVLPEESLGSRAPRVARAKSDRRERREARVTAERAARDPSSAVAPRAPRAPSPPRPASISPAGWLGVAIECQPCGGERVEGVDHPVWRFGEPPRIVTVEPRSPAALAGLRDGDRLTHLNGILLTSERGGRRFGAIEPGEELSWTVVRGGRARTVTLEAATRPGAPRPAVEYSDEPVILSLERLAELENLVEVRREIERILVQLQGLRTSYVSIPEVAPAPSPSPRLRYSGRLGLTDIEVRGARPVIVTARDAEGEILISGEDFVIRLRNREE